MFAKLYFSMFNYTTVLLFSLKIFLRKKTCRVGEEKLNWKMSPENKEENKIYTKIEAVIFSFVMRRDNFIFMCV